MGAPPMGTKRGQALMELAVGMFAFALVVSALCIFATYIARSLVAQNALRKDGNGGSNSKSDSVEVGDFAAKNLIGGDTLKIEEKVVLPDRTIAK